MRRRCTNPNNADWKQYGGRGIKVCDRWIESFDNFLADMGPRPSPKHSIGRFPNNDGNYEPRNCRWATAAEQHLRFQRYADRSAKKKAEYQRAKERGFYVQRAARRAASKILTER
jgi:hypothetical protein